MGERARDKQPLSQLPGMAKQKAAVVRCPRCLAPAGHRCKNSKGIPIAAHAERVRAAAEQGHQPSRQAERERQAAEYQADAATPINGQARNPMDEFFARRRYAKTSGGRSDEERRRINGG